MIKAYSQEKSWFFAFGLFSLYRKYWYFLTDCNVSKVTVRNLRMYLFFIVFQKGIRRCVLQKTQKIFAVLLWVLHLRNRLLVASRQFFKQFCHVHSTVGWSEKKIFLQKTGRYQKLLLYKYINCRQFYLWKKWLGFALLIQKSNFWVNFDIFFKFKIPTEMIPSFCILKIFGKKVVFPLYLKHKNKFLLVVGSIYFSIWSFFSDIHPLGENRVIDGKYVRS